MYKGSTPTFILKLPVHADSITAMQVTFVQENNSMLSIDMERITLDSTYATFTLEEWETLEFVSGLIADIQLTIWTNDGKTIVSDIKKIAIQKKYPEDIY